MPNLAQGEHDAILNGIRIHYTIRGSGPALVLHFGGPGMDARGWDDCAGLDSFFTLIAIHPRGSGLSDPAGDSSYRLSDYAADLEALLLRLGLEAPLVLGWSHGGMVAQVFASSYPKSLSGLVLLDTESHLDGFVGGIEAAVRQFEGRPWYAESLEALQQEWAGEFDSDEAMAALWDKEMKFYFKDFDERTEAYRRKTSGLPIRIAPLRFFNEREAPTMDLRPLLARIEVPTLVLVGRHDFITTVSAAEEIARLIPRASLAVLEDSGHFGFIEEPERFREAILGFAPPRQSPTPR